MTGWVILVRYENGDVNISQDGYELYIDAVRAVHNKIKEDNLKIIDDYNYYDKETEILYILKTLHIRKAR